MNDVESCNICRAIVIVINMPQHKDWHNRNDIDPIAVKDIVKDALDTTYLRMR